MTPPAPGFAGYSRDARFWGGKWTDEGLLLSLGPHPESLELEGVYTVYRRGSGSLLEPEGRVLEMPGPAGSADGRVQVPVWPGGQDHTSPFQSHTQMGSVSGWDVWYTNGRDLGGRYEIHRIDLESGDTLLTIVRRYECNP